MTGLAAIPLRETLLALPSLPSREDLKQWLQDLSFDGIVRAFERHFMDNPEGLRLAVGIALALAGIGMLLSSLRRQRRTRQADLVRRVAAGASGAADAGGRPETPRATGEVGGQAHEPPRQAGPPAWLLTEPAANGPVPALASSPSGRPGTRVPLGASLVRIGRHEENDVRFEHKTVHRYHAVLHRTGEGEFVITDLSGTGGNGIYVNGARIEQAPLRSGDLVELGAVRLRFEEARAH